MTWLGVAAGVGTEAGWLLELELLELELLELEAPEPESLEFEALEFEALEFEALGEGEAVRPTAVVVLRTRCLPRCRAAAAASRSRLL